MLNTKTARQDHSPTRAPPITGPAARASPDTADHTPRAWARSPRSGYSCRIIDNVPGSDAAAPTPMITRAAIRTPLVGAAAPSTDPTVNTARPATMRNRRPRWSPSVPNDSIRAANVRA